MKIVLLAIGKTNDQYLLEGIADYQKRLTYYTKFEIVELPSVKNSKNLSHYELLKKEGALILNYLDGSDNVILLDVKGKGFTSHIFAKKLQKWILSGKKRLVFIVGGAYGFSNLVYDRADEKLSLSTMTFSHQMIRLFFIEQIYRGYTILNREPYHH